MNDFLAGFAAQKENPINIDVTEELKDLAKVHTEAHAHLQKREKDSLGSLVYYMKSFIEVYEEKKKLGVKIDNLREKLRAAIYPQCDENEEGDDE